MSDVMTRPEPRTLRLNAADNIAVALSNLDVGTLTPEGVTTVKRVPRGHKCALRAIRSGEAVVKFGQIIGFATKDIPAGDWVHEHNCGIGEQHGAFNRNYAFGEGVVPTRFVPEAQRANVSRFHRLSAGCWRWRRIFAKPQLGCCACCKNGSASSNHSTADTRLECRRPIELGHL